MDISSFQSEELKHYARHLSLTEIGLEGQQKLKQARVLVIGAGGLGCPVLQYLVAAGVGKIGIVDNDVVNKSNLQRQVMYTIADIGKLKTQVAYERLGLLNPHIQLIPYPLYLSATNALEIIKEYDIVVDGSDNFPTRYLINDACVLLKKPFVFGSIFKFEGQLSVFNYNNGPTYRCLYAEPPMAGEMPNCSEVGVLGVLPGIIGSLQANEVLKLITGLGIVLSGKLLLFDALQLSFQFVEIETIIANKQLQTLSAIEELCTTDDFEITAVELKHKQLQQHDLQLIDVREPYEHKQFNITAAELIPVTEIRSSIHRIAPDKPVIIYCQKGSRSKSVVKLLRTEYGFKNVFSLTGGLEAY